MASGTGTLLDLSKLSTDVPTNVVHTIVDCMPLFDQMRFAPCNNGVNNKTMVITDYPEGQTRGYNEGLSPEKAGGMVVQDSTCMLGTYCQIDVNLLKQNKNSAEWRYNQEAAFNIGLAHHVAEMVFNASLKKDPKSFDGILARYGKTGGKFADVVLDAGGKSGSSKGLGDILIVNWGSNTIHGIYPEGGVAGLQRYDRGEQDCRDKNGKRFRGVVTDFEWNLGLAVEDRRQVVRVANIDIGALDAKADTGADLVDMLIDAVEMFPVTPGAGCAIYMNAALRTMLRKQIGRRQNVNLQWETVAGRKVVTYDGLPVHKLPTSILGTYATPLPVSAA